ncbi:MAG: glycosyltransferase family 4 protein [Clostridia bacterium]|nr:glycosyltransferase family 4 protein [Clostridia bacterium]
MNVLFLTMNTFTGINMHNIYSDLMLEFISKGHRPYIVTPREKKTGEATELVDYADHSILKVRIGNTSNVSLIEKGISTVTLSHLYYDAIKKHLGDIDFGLILYSTPPITLSGPVKKLKRIFKAKTYLMLKDIFPQNAVDLGMFGKNNPIYAYFRAKEKKLYKISDKIGCMSQANVEYVLENNPMIDRSKVGLCYNAVIPCKAEDNTQYKKQLKQDLGLDEDTVVYLYGGNLGKPQDIPFLIECLKANENKRDRYFIICGSGGDYNLLDDYVNQAAPANVKLISFLPKPEYDALVKGCDAGLVFLSHRFTIPNFPSRLLSYMENSLPTVICSDTATDMGKIAEENGFGWWCESDNAENFTKVLDHITKEKASEFGTRARKYLEENYTADKCCEAILEAIK